MSQALPSLVSSTLKQENFAVYPEWLAQCLQYLQTQGFGNSPETVISNVKFHLLHSDLSATSVPTLPENISKNTHKITVGEPTPGISHGIILQINDVMEVGESTQSLLAKIKELRVSIKKPPNVVNAEVLVENNLSDEEKIRKSLPRKMLKFVLTDGHQDISAMEVQAINELDMTLKLGTKLLIRNASIRRGMLLLSPNNVSVLGGHVDIMNEEPVFDRIEKKFRNHTHTRACRLPTDKVPTVVRGQIEAEHPVEQQPEQMQSLNLNGFEEFDNFENFEAHPEDLLMEDDALNGNFENLDPEDMNYDDFQFEDIHNNFFEFEPEMQTVKRERHLQSVDDDLHDFFVNKTPILAAHISRPVEMIKIVENSSTNNQNVPLPTTSSLQSSPSVTGERRKRVVVEEDESEDGFEYKKFPDKIVETNCLDFPKFQGKIASPPSKRRISGADEFIRETVDMDLQSGSQRAGNSQLDILPHDTHYIVN
ncbi:hypothetical protein HK096_001860, partial [Nowakowskiella sp. JEL0078]